tara:strand:+ start:792 stop:1061 length:270 start_codon:yes stop_codon:yes gene_type:complete
MLKQIKANNPNIYIIIVAIAVSLWFEGVGLLLKLCLPERNTHTALIMITTALGIFYLDDGNLSELYNYNPEKDKLIRHAPPAIAARRYE